MKTVLMTTVRGTRRGPWSHGGAYYKIRIGGEIVTSGDDGEPLTVRGKDAARDKLQDLR
jgi:hypothetical protein